jgi:hypothetical protein
MKTCLSPIHITGLNISKPSKVNPMQLPVHTDEIVSFLMGAFVLRSIGSAITALPPARSQFGFYAWFSRWAHLENNLIEQYAASRLQAKADLVSSVALDKYSPE